MKQNAIILVAEDDMGHFTLVRKNLVRSSLGNPILHFKDGQEIVDFLFGKAGLRPANSPNLPQFDPRNPYVVLLDIRMPKIDGVEVLRRIKADESLRRMPVIMLTTTDDPTEIDRCYSLGCSFYIVKPADYLEFMNAVEQLGRFLSLPGVQVAPVTCS
jgi:CheY-like chemotaxis protein